MDGLECPAVPHAAAACVWSSGSDRSVNPTAWTHVPSLQDRPPPGQWVYRVVVTTSRSGGVEGGNFLLFSSTTTVIVPSRVPL